MTVSSSRVITVLTAAAVVSVAGLVSFNGGGASAQPTTAQPTTTQPTTTKPTQPTTPAKPAPQPAKPGDAAPPPPPPPGPGGEQRPERGSGGDRVGSLGSAMKGMDRALNQLQKQVGDTKKKEENLRLIGSVERNCIAAKDFALPPEMLEKLKDEAEKVKLANTYRKHMVTLMRKLLDLEMFVMDDKTDAANSKLLEIVKYRDDSHELFSNHE